MQVIFDFSNLKLVNFQTALGLVYVPPSWIDALVQSYPRHCTERNLAARALLSLLRVLGPAADLVPLGRLHMRPIQLFLLCHWRPIKDPLVP